MNHSQSIIMLLILSLPASGWGQTTLYACTHDGQVSLESSKPKDCDKLQVYEYPDYQSHQSNKSGESVQNQNGLRPEEIRLLNRHEVQETIATRRFENVDTRVGFGVSGIYLDSRQDKCAAATAQLNSTLAIMGVDPKSYRGYYGAGPYSQTIVRADVREGIVDASLQEATTQVYYYCGH